MRVEVPVFKRCCFCMPLRRGLIAWAYLSVVICVFALIDGIVLVYDSILNGIENGFMTITIATYIDTITLILNIGFTVMFIVAAHTKNHKFFKIYYYFKIFLAGIDVLIQLTFIIWMLVVVTDYKNVFIPLTATCLVGCFNVGIQIYMILLVRSEMIKLSETCDFRFTNTAAEAKCVMMPGAEEDLV